MKSVLLFTLLIIPSILCSTLDINPVSIQPNFYYRQALHNKSNLIEVITQNNLAFDLIIASNRECDRYLTGHNYINYISNCTNCINFSALVYMPPDDSGYCLLVKCLSGINYTNSPNVTYYTRCFCSTNPNYDCASYSANISRAVLIENQICRLYIDVRNHIII